MIVAIAIASFGLSMVTFDVLRQQQSLKEQLVGTWTLLAWEQKKGDGTKVERYGTSPKGIAFFDAGGRYIITVMRSDRAKYARNALWQGTAEENKETADGTTTYFGTYSISDGGGGAGAGRAIGDRAGGAVTSGEGVEVFKQARARA
jgi:hypothetical protein